MKSIASRIRLGVLGAWALVAAFTPAGYTEDKVVWEKNFNNEAVGTDYTSQVVFFANGSRNPEGDGGRASNYWEVAEDPLSSSNKALVSLGGATGDHDSWYFAETATNTEVNKGAYTRVQADLYIPTVAQGDGDYRVGLFGYIDPDKGNSYGAWFKWSERKMRVGKLEKGQEINAKSEEFAADADVDQWYTMQLFFKKLGGGQLEVKATIFPKTDPSKATSATNVVAFDAEKTFAIGIYMYSNDRENKMWDNFQAVEEVKPIANAGLPFTAVAGQKNVLLDGSQSIGAKTYKWEVIPRDRIIDPASASEGNTGAIERDPTQTIPVIRDADKAMAYFDAPAVIPSGAERVQFKLTINQGQADQSEATVYAYLQPFGGKSVARDTFAAPTGGWDYAWDGDVSPLGALGLFKKNFSFDYDLGSHGQSDPVPPAGWAEDWSQDQRITTMHTESGLIVCRWSGNNTGTFMNLDDLFTDLGDKGVFDDKGATVLIKARNFDLMTDAEAEFQIYPKPYDSRTGGAGYSDEFTVNPIGSRVGFGSKGQNAEAILAYGDGDEQVYLFKANGETSADAGVPVPNIKSSEFSTLWVTVQAVGGQPTVKVYNKPDSQPLLQQTVTRVARRSAIDDPASAVDANIAKNYFRIDLENVTAQNELLIDYLCLKRGVFAPSATPTDVEAWPLF